MSRHSDIYDLVDFTKQNLGIDDGQAQQFAKDIAHQFGGEYLYINKRFNQYEQHKEIRALYDGKNVRQLAKQFGLCERQIYNIVSS